jgi:general secretion pathway protein K
MTALGWLWNELVRPRGPTTHRFYRVGRSSRSGVALLIAISCFLVLAVIATEIVSVGTVRMKLVANMRDEARAEYLAHSGLNFYRLILVAANGLDQRTSGMAQAFPMLQQMGISGDMLWQMIPMINTNLLRMIFVSGGSADAEDLRELEAEGGLSDEDRERSEDGRGRKPGFLSFQGDFVAEVSDESRRINVRNVRGTDVVSLQQDPAGAQLFALMTGQQSCAAIRAGRPMSTSDIDDNTQWFRERSLEPLELIGNLADWTDIDSSRAYMGGNEDTLYERLEPPYRAKNAPFDTLDEIRLVDGWHRDDVWDKFGDRLTVFGDGKVNVNTAECEVLWALLKSGVVPPPPDFQVDSCIRAIEMYRSVVPFGNPQSFVQYLQGGAGPPMGAMLGSAPNMTGRCDLTPGPQMQQLITTKTKVFRVRSVGEVNDAKVTIEAVYDFSASVEGKTLYWRID